MKTSEIKQKLVANSRDELKIIAKKLKIKNRHKLRNDELISSILQNDNKILASIINVTWWDKYHKHIYGISGILGVILAIVFYLLSTNNKSPIGEKLSDSELAVKSTIALESNLIETYLFDDPYNLKLVLQNESDNNWHDIDFNIFTLYFINDEPCLSQDRGPFVHKITKDISFIGSGKSFEKYKFLG